MYKVNDMVVYGNNGVCVVKAIGGVEIKGVDPDQQFYTLHSIYDDVKILTPTDTNIPMRPVLCKTQVLELIDGIPDADMIELNDPDPRKIENTYRELISTGECEDLLALIKFIYQREKTALEAGKKLGQIDQRYLKNAETRINGEFAIALDIPREQVYSFITQRLDPLENADA